MPARILIALIVCLSVTVCKSQNTPIGHGHAHNDYLHTRPLIDALENGFTSIEIDVFLHNNDLVVAHTATSLNKKKNIEELYLKPIQAIVERNGGTVYKGSQTPVIFMIDFKTGSAETYAKLREILMRYRNLLTLYKGDSVISKGPISILISGSKPFKEVMKEDTGMVTIDADIKQMKETTYDRVITRYSDPWERYFVWDGNGDFPAGEKARLDSLVANAHAKGKQIRFYHIPDTPEVWRTLLNAGVDWINTDKLAAYRKFFEDRFGKH